ncbi:MAG: hypothetical protein JWN95_646 [Frankiales bacterium]|nr:hypothetical protein [Frankiales bacterium]
MADDWDQGGVVRLICAGWEDAPAGDFVQLRLLAGLHRLVLTGQEPSLARFYPNLGGTADPAGAWPPVREAMKRHVAELADDLRIAPQTNEPGRAVALLVGLFHSVRQSGLAKIRLLEPGASAGLNLLLDHYRISGRQPQPWWYGPAESPVVLSDAVLGAVTTAPFTIVERRGCDLAPIDATTAEGRLRLISFVWPFHVERHLRLAAALQVAAEHPVSIDEAGASGWLAAQLSVAPEPDVLTVVWHSVTRVYWTAEERTKVAGLLAAAGRRMPLAYITMEQNASTYSGNPELDVTLRQPGAPAGATILASAAGHGATVRLATVPDHGVPVRIIEP